VANNRMYLCFRPTGHVCFLGKRMGWGWYTASQFNLNEKLQEFFEFIEGRVPADASQDDFCIVQEEDTAWTRAEPYQEGRWQRIAWKEPKP
jgi:hypothetical protein